MAEAFTLLHACWRGNRARVLTVVEGVVVYNQLGLEKSRGGGSWWYNSAMVVGTVNYSRG